MLVSCALGFLSQEKLEHLIISSFLGNRVWRFVFSFSMDDLLYNELLERFFKWRIRIEVDGTVRMSSAPVASG